MDGWDGNAIWVVDWQFGSGIVQFGRIVGGASTSYTATGLPTDGRTLYVRLWSLVSGIWQFNDYTYTAL